MKYSKDIAQLSKEEAFAMLTNLKKEYMHLRFQKKLEGVNVSELRKARRNIAKVFTRLNKKES